MSEPARKHAKQELDQRARREIKYGCLAQFAPKTNVAADMMDEVEEAIRTSCLDRDHIQAQIDVLDELYDLVADDNDKVSVQEALANAIDGFKSIQLIFDAVAEYHQQGMGDPLSELRKTCPKWFE
jgi:transcription termination factor NusB